jgi:hypothetical protein
MEGERRESSREGSLDERRQSTTEEGGREPSREGALDERRVPSPSGGSLGIKAVSVMAEEGCREPSREGSLGFATEGSFDERRQSTTEEGGREPSRESPAEEG